VIDILGKIGPSSIACLWPNTLVDLSQFFSILNELKCYRNTFSSFTNHLGNAKPRDQPKKSYKEILFYKLQTRFFSFFFILTPSIFELHNFLSSYSF
jgi:hypothetical protein